MISVASLWQRIGQLSKNGTSGYQSEAEFNNDLYAAQIEISRILCDNFENNTKAADALSNLVVTLPATTSSMGILPKPSNYLRLLSIWYVNGLGKTFPTTKASVNEVSLYRSSPVRTPSIELNQVVYYLANNTINFEPAVVMNLQIVYCKKPSPASLKLTLVSGSDRDYQTVDVVNTVNLNDWPEEMFNIFVYSMLEKLGVESKENLIYEYSQIGINRELAKA